MLELLERSARNCGFCQVQTSGSVTRCEHCYTSSVTSGLCTPDVWWWVVVEMPRQADPKCSICKLCVCQRKARKKHREAAVCEKRARWSENLVYVKSCHLERYHDICAAISPSEGRGEPSAPENAAFCVPFLLSNAKLPNEIVCDYVLRAQSMRQGWT